MRMPGVREAWDAVIPPKETPQQRLERIELHGDAAQKAYSHLVEACIDSPVALNAVVAHQTLTRTSGQIPCEKCWKQGLPYRPQIAYKFHSRGSILCE